MATMLERLEQAWNSHDAQAVALLCAEDYISAQPVHPSRAFTGRVQVLTNWTGVFDGVPDFHAELVACSIDGDTEWGEWDWTGRHQDISSFAMRGITIFTVRDGLIASGRLYMEPVDAADGDIDAAVRDLYRSR
jgi:ketosteroid isomerase-like protein